MSATHYLAANLHHEIGAAMRGQHASHAVCPEAFGHRRAVEDNGGIGLGESGIVVEGYEVVAHIA